MAPPIRLFLADVDGTLVTQDKVLTDRAIAAVAKLKQAGILFAITSGRPPRGMSMLIEPLQLTTPIAAFNGGVFIRPDMSVIEQQTIPDDRDADGDRAARRPRTGRVDLPGRGLVYPGSEGAARGPRVLDGQVRPNGDRQLCLGVGWSGQDRRGER